MSSPTSAVDRAWWQSDPDMDGEHPVGVTDLDDEDIVLGYTRTEAAAKRMATELGALLDVPVSERDDFDGDGDNPAWDSIELSETWSWDTDAPHTDCPSATGRVVNQPPVDGRLQVSAEVSRLEGLFAQDTQAARRVLTHERYEALGYEVHSHRDYGDMLMTRHEIEAIHDQVTFRPLVGDQFLIFETPPVGVIQCLEDESDRRRPDLGAWDYVWWQEDSQGDGAWIGTARRAGCAQMWAHAPTVKAAKLAARAIAKALQVPAEEAGHEQHAVLVSIHRRIRGHGRMCPTCSEAPKATLGAVYAMEGHPDWIATVIDVFSGGAMLRVECPHGVGASPWVTAMPVRNSELSSYALLGQLDPANGFFPSAMAFARDPGYGKPKKAPFRIGDVFHAREGLADQVTSRHRLTLFGWTCREATLYPWVRAEDGESEPFFTMLDPAALDSLPWLGTAPRDPASMYPISILEYGADDRATRH